MVKKIGNICMLFCILLLVSCANIKEEKKTVNDMAYILELQDSPGFEQFIKYYISVDTGYFLFKQDDQNVFSKNNLDSKQTTIEYYEYSDEQLKRYYDHLFDSQQLETDFLNLRQSKETLFHAIENKAMYHLPEIHIIEDNILTVETTKNKKEFQLTDLLKAYHVESADDIILNVVALNENSFQIDIHNLSIESPLKKDVSIFMTNDLENVFVTQTFTDEFLENILAGHLHLYIDLLITLDSENRFIKAANSHVIVDTVEKEVIQINESDYVSEDSKYVYINGNDDPLVDGKQQIQKLEDYVMQ